ncbi:mRNA interferase MazF [Halomonas cerina]|uniref:mRNA interferase MazF n=2 Tax=Halomonas cerina TaxID=447424 RepID=A0A839VAC9_9GAMM|nr:mRNA interferase MazF [Halomonas cerina]
MGTEIRKTRPALVVSPDDMNAALPRVIVAPVTTSKGQPLGCRPTLVFQDKPARILLDQVRCIDKRRLLGRMGVIPESVWHATLLEMLQ